MQACAGDAGSEKDERLREREHQERVQRVQSLWTSDEPESSELDQAEELDQAQAGTGSKRSRSSEHQPTNSGKKRATRRNILPDFQSSGAHRTFPIVQSFDAEEDEASAAGNRVKKVARQKVTGRLNLEGEGEALSARKRGKRPADADADEDVMDLTQCGDDDAEREPAEEQRMLRSRGVFCRKQRCMVFQATPSQPPPPSGAGGWGGWGGSAAQGPAGIREAAQPLSNASMASSLAMAASDTAEDRSSTSRSGGGGAGAAGGEGGGASGGGTQLRFEPGRQARLVSTTTHIDLDRGHLSKCFLWLVMLSESDPELAIVVYQEHNKGIAYMTEVPIRMLKLGEASQQPPNKCRIKIKEILDLKQKFDDFSQRVQHEQSVVDNNPNNVLMLHASSRQQLPAVQRAYGDNEDTRALQHRILRSHAPPQDPRLVPGCPSAMPTAQEITAASEEADLAEAEARRIQQEIETHESLMKRQRAKVRELKLQQKQHAKEEQRRRDAEGSDEADRWLASVMEHAEAENAQAAARRAREVRISPRNFMQLISRITNVLGERTKGFAAYKKKIMEKYGKFIDGKTFYKYDHQWVSITGFEVSLLLQGLTTMNEEFKRVELQTGSRVETNDDTENDAPQDEASLLPVSAGRVTIVAQNRTVLTNARPVIQRFLSDGTTTHTVVQEPRWVVRGRHNAPEVDENNPFGRPAQVLVDFNDLIPKDELINPAAAAASAEQPAAASASHQDDAENNAQHDDVDDAPDCMRNTISIPSDLLRELSMAVGPARKRENVLGSVREVLRNDALQLITAAGDPANDTPAPAANDTIAGSAEEPQEISGAVIEHVHTSTFMHNCFKIVQARQMLNIAHDVTTLNPEQLHQIYLDVICTLHADKNLDKSEEWQKAADLKIAQVTWACNLLRKHYHSTRRNIYRVPDPDFRQPNLQERAPAGNFDDEDAVELDEPQTIPETLIFTAPQLIAWCNQNKFNFKKILYSRWVKAAQGPAGIREAAQPLSNASMITGEWVWASFNQLPPWLQNALETECALAIIRASAWSAIQSAAEERSAAVSSGVDASAAEGGSAAVASAVDGSAAEGSSHLRRTHMEYMAAVDAQRPGTGGHYGNIHAPGAPAGSADTHGLEETQHYAGSTPAAIETGDAVLMEIDSAPLRVNTVATLQAGSQEEESASGSEEEVPDTYTSTQSAMSQGSRGWEFNLGGRGA
jgi:hypothetical protein